MSLPLSAKADCHIVTDRQEGAQEYGLFFISDPEQAFEVWDRVQDSRLYKNSQPRPSLRSLHGTFDRVFVVPQQ